MVDVHSGPSFAPGSDYLSRLPVELLLRITRQLNTNELCAVRLCSRTLEHALRYFFLYEYFRRRQFMLTELSLQTLLAFAQHPDISQTLCHVMIGVEDFCRGYRDYPDDKKLATTLTMLAANQKALMANGRAIRLLSAAFSLLPNLETVELRDEYPYMELRNGSYVAWSSYGLRHMRQQLGAKAQYLLTTSCSPDFPSLSFSHVVAALAQTKARPPNLEMVCAINYQAFDLSPAPRLYVQGGSGEAGVDVYAYAVLAGLRRLHLTLQCGYHPLESEEGEIGNPSFQSRDARAFAEYLPVRAWLAHCPNVEWLRLNLLEEACSYNGDFLKQLGTPLPANYSLPPASTALSDITMPFASHLRRFDLGSASCRVNVLLKLLDRLPALEHLSLWLFSLVYDDRHPFTIWKDFLASLAKSPLGAQLKQLSLRRVGTVTHTDYFPQVLKTHGAMFNGQDSVEYIAKDEKSMAHWLQNMVVRLKPQAAWSGAYDSDLDSVDSDEIDDGTSSDLYVGSMFEYESDAELEGGEDHEANGEGEDNGQSLP
ncbi:hypothetical protein SEPCBS119000_004573 [Sporothrix epigloea]|uniref:F-box domain-containing protein n=1 Tax=Sporothrix epigloea TaxID=1892477 RepID=A0ABP0DU29_9PEZI